MSQWCYIDRFQNCSCLPRLSYILYIILLRKDFVNICSRHIRLENTLKNYEKKSNSFFNNFLYFPLTRPLKLKPNIHNHQIQISILL